MPFFTGKIRHLALSASTNIPLLHYYTLYQHNSSPNNERPHPEAILGVYDILLSDEYNQLC